MGPPDRPSDHTREEPRPPPEPRTTVLVVEGPIERADIDALCRTTQRRLEESAADALACDLGALYQADAVTVEALARLCLTARRVGLDFGMLHASPHLEELICFMGLQDVLGDRSPP